jgi:thymidine kinase
VKVHVALKKILVCQEKHKMSGGRIELVIGPMFSGKSTELIRRLNRYKACNETICVLKPIIDDRYDKVALVSHDKVVSRHPIVLVNSLAEFESKYPFILQTASVIGIDEGQFFPDVIHALLWANNLKKKIVITALSGDYRQQMFDNIAQLLPKCDQVHCLTAICQECKQEEAAFTWKKVQSDDAVVQIDVGGQDKYLPLCRKCWNKYTFVQHLDHKIETSSSKPSN